MTSTLSIGPEQQRLEGRTVRDIVEYDPAQVNEVWCRKIFRQLLQSLELQYAMQMPHRDITPDTVVFHENGEPLLLPSIIGAPEENEAADLTALARVVHFAITKELAPSGPLRGRSLPDYSDSLIGAVDRCMSPDPAQRPKTIAELRDILGIVNLGPLPGAPLTAPPAAPRAASPVSGTPAAADAPLAQVAPAAPAGIAPAAAAAEGLPNSMREPGRSRVGLTRWQRRLVAAGGGAFLLAVALALYAELRDSGDVDHIVLSLPGSSEQSADRQAAGNAPLPVPAEPEPAPPSALQPAPDNGAAVASAPVGMGAAQPDAPGASPANTLPAPAMPGAVAAAPAASRIPVPAQPPAVGGSATYKLQILPWGVVYVDGVDRGVSPPVKRLTLGPGRHTIRISNPNFHDRVLEVDPAAGGGQIAVDFTDRPR